MSLDFNLFQKKRIDSAFNRLQMLLQNKSCGTCKSDKKTVTKKSYSLLTGILLAILPKCPFCVMAYTSTAFLCGKDTLIEVNHHHYSIVTISITAILCLFVIVGILLNYRDIRTKYALTLAGLGTLVILQSIIFSGGEQLYYLGVSMIFMAVWLNGSLFSFLRTVKKMFSSFPKAAENSPVS